MKTAIYHSPLGEILLSSDGAALTGLWFKGQKYEGRGLPENCVNTDISGDGVFIRASEWLNDYFAGKLPETDFELRPKGTAFQLKVWKALTEINYGETASYGMIAEKIGCRSARAVGSAVGKNPISLIIPCHRVLGADGSLTGYAGGTERKKKLLELEAVNKK